jgi:hypothetical protein
MIVAALALNHTRGREAVSTAAADRKRPRWGRQRCATNCYRRRQEV